MIAFFSKPYKVKRFGKERIVDGYASSGYVDISPISLDVQEQDYTMTSEANGKRSPKRLTLLDSLSLLPPSHLIRGAICSSTRANGMSANHVSSTVTRCFGTFLLPSSSIRLKEGLPMNANKLRKLLRDIVQMYFAKATVLWSEGRNTQPKKPYITLKMASAGRNTHYTYEDDNGNPCGFISSKARLEVNLFTNGLIKLIPNASPLFINTAVGDLEDFLQFLSQVTR